MLYAQVERLHHQLKTIDKIRNVINRLQQFEEEICNLDKCEIQVEDKNIGSFFSTIRNILENVVHAIIEQALNISEEKHEAASYDKQLIYQAVTSFCNVAIKLLKFLDPFNNDGIAAQVKLAYGPSVVNSCFIFGDSIKVLDSIAKQTCIQDLQNLFLLVIKSESVIHTLNNTNTEFYQNNLRLILPYMSSVSWKKYPSICRAYGSLLQSSNDERLRESLHMILPPLLLFIDDFQTANVVLGLICLQKVYSAVPSAEIRMFGWAEVIYDALVKTLYSRDSEVVKLCLPCLLFSIEVLERDPKKADHHRKFTKYDEVFQIILSNISTCTQNELLRSYWMNVSPYINVMGITIARHLKDILGIIEFQLDVVNPLILQPVLESIETIIRVAWIRMNHHVPTLLLSLLKLAVRFNTENAETKHFHAIRRCIEHLSLCNNSLVEETLNELRSHPYWSEKHLHAVLNCQPSNDETAFHVDESL